MRSKEDLLKPLEYIFWDGSTPMERLEQLKLAVDNRDIRVSIRDVLNKIHDRLHEIRNEQAYRNFLFEKLVMLLEDGITVYVEKADEEHGER